jgi:hypothetical protein
MIVGKELSKLLDLIQPRPRRDYSPVLRSESVVKQRRKSTHRNRSTDVTSFLPAITPGRVIAREYATDLL